MAMSSVFNEKVAVCCDVAFRGKLLKSLEISKENLLKAVLNQFSRLSHPKNIEVTFDGLKSKHLEVDLKNNFPVKQQSICSKR